MSLEWISIECPIAPANVQLPENKSVTPFLSSKCSIPFKINSISFVFDPIYFIKLGKVRICNVILLLIILNYCVYHSLTFGLSVFEIVL